MKRFSKAAKYAAKSAKDNALENLSFTLKNAQRTGILPGLHQVFMLPSQAVMELKNEKKQCKEHPH